MREAPRPGHGGRVVCNHRGGPGQVGRQAAGQRRERRYGPGPQAAGTGLSPVSRLLRRIRRRREARHGDHRPPGRRVGDGPDRLSALRQHAHGHCRGDPIFVVALHGQLHSPHRSRRAGGAAGLGDPIVSPARDCRHSRGTGGGTDLVSALPSAAVVFVLLAAGTAPLQPGGAGGAGACGGLVGFSRLPAWERMLFSSPTPSA